MDVQEIAQLVRRQGEDLSRWQNDETKRLDQLEIRLNRAALFGDLGGGGGSATGVKATPDQIDALARGIRALYSKDQAGADKAFGEYKAAIAGSDPDGGYLLLPSVSMEMQRIFAEISPIADLARNINLEQGLSWEEPVDKDQAEALWVGEEQTRSDTANPQLGKLRIECNEIYCQPKVTQTLIDASSKDVVSWMQEKIGESFAAKESAAFHSGSGAGQPRGFLTYPVATTGDATRAWGTIQYVPTGASAAFATPSTSVNPADVLVDTVGALRQQYRIGSSWLMSRTTAAVCRKLKDADGRHVWVDNLQVGEPAALLGFPVRISEDMPAIAANSLSIAFGNFKRAYTTIRRMGTRFLLDPYTAKPYVRVYAYQRVGGGCTNFEAIKLLKFAAS